MPHGVAKKKKKKKRGNEPRGFSQVKVPARPTLVTAECLRIQTREGSSIVLLEGEGELSGNLNKVLGDPHSSDGLQSCPILRHGAGP